jgi:hypothetical protein
MLHAADIRDPRELRAMLHGTYEGYMQGANRFPRLRLKRGPETLAKKTQPIAKALGRAWAEIDLDRAYFDKAIEAALDNTQDPDSELSTATVVTQIGRNAVNFAHVRTNEDTGQPEILFAQYTAQEFAKQFEGVEFTVGDGHTLALREGELVGDPPFGSGIMQRGSKSGGIFTTSPRNTLSMMRSLTDQPINVVRSVETVLPLDPDNEE